jgi:predicted ester cyclase
VTGLSNKAIIQSAVSAVNQGDTRGYLTFFSPSCLRWVAGFDQPISLVDVGDHLSQLIEAFNPLRLDEELLIADDRFVCARWRLRGTQVSSFMGSPSHGNSIDVATCEVYEIANGLVVESWVYQDPGQLFTQIAAGRSASSPS